MILFIEYIFEIIRLVSTKWHIETTISVVPHHPAETCLTKIIKTIRNTDIIFWSPVSHFIICFFVVCMSFHEIVYFSGFSIGNRAI
ncbi:hypothetical protein AR158_c347L [Paramecium bursaria Chlorella virus AR158]|uniref:hypothetical protein n=1 Tax=Paramecium bursaria Chlorella virus AR158 TaxID=380598 RepID=UPI00015AA942|nr:hypothetical protein AR158_c347L [Paramecium bursaria Chlorella virus AR158]ABU43892.1 hypothetical protein AR158_c347L [Paramecium bursaria Chlorella virus AR158]